MHHKPSSIPEYLARRLPVSQKGFELLLLVTKRDFDIFQIGLQGAPFKLLIHYRQPYWPRK